MARLYLSLLGGFLARLEPGGPLPVSTRKAQALLAYLALPVGRAHPRDKLAALLWGGIREESARNNFRQALFVLRKALAAAPVFQLEGQNVALNGACISLDVADFEDAVAVGTPEALENAAALYQGDLLAGLVVDELPFEEWLLGESERLRELALEGLAKLLVHQQSTGAIEGAIRTALRVSALDPLRESAHRTLMELYAISGRRGAALRQYQLCVGVLHRELGVEPEPLTKQLYREIVQRRGAPAAEADMALPAAPGEHMWPRRSPIIHGHESARLPMPETPLVGRDVDLARFQRAMAEAERGHGGVVLLKGEAGIGKSTLIGALAAEAERRGARVVLGRSYGSEQILPFAPWVDAFRAGYLTRDHRVLDMLDPIWRAELARLLPEFALPGGPVASEDRHRLFESVAHLLDSLAATQPVVLILEDVHWADEMSVRLLSFIGRRLGMSPILMVISAREEDLTDAPTLRLTIEELEREPHFAQLSLTPLSRVDTTVLIRLLARARSDDASVMQLSADVWAVSEGHPFTIVETMRALHDGAVSVSPGGLPLAERVRQVTSARLERLGRHARQLLAVAAVVGRDFDFAVARQATELDEGDAADGLEELVRRRVLHGVDERFDFVHDRIRAVVYDQLLPPRRRYLHGLVAQAMEALYMHNIERHYASLGWHYKHAEVWDKGVFYLRRAGEQAMSRSAYHEAVVSFQTTHEIIKRLPGNRGLMEQAVDVLIDLSNSLIPLSDHGRALQSLLEAEGLTATLGDQRRMARVLSSLCAAFWLLGLHKKAVESGERALAIGTALDDAGIHALANFRLGRVLYSLGDYRMGAKILAQSLGAFPGALVRDGVMPPGSLRSTGPKLFLAWCLAELGAFPEAIAQIEDSVRIADAADQTYARVQVYLGLGRVRLLTGEIDAAIRVLEHGRALCRAIDAPFQFHLTAGQLAYAYALRGRADDGLPLLNDAVQHVTHTSGLYGQALMLGCLSEAYLLAGQLDKARVTATRALELCRARDERGREAYTLRLLGEVAGACDPVDVQTADDYYRQALELARQLGMRPLMAHCHLGLGLLYKKATQQARARSEIETAIAEYRAMGSTSWLNRAEAALQDAR